VSVSSNISINYSKAIIENNNSNVLNTRHVAKHRYVGIETGRYWNPEKPSPLCVSSLLIF
jgi:hypothetical protein